MAFETLPLVCAWIPLCCRKAALCCPVITNAQAKHTMAPLQDGLLASCLPRDETGGAAWILPWCAVRTWWRYQQGGEPQIPSALCAPV